MEQLDLAGTRRLALARAGLLKPSLTGLPSRAGRSARAQRRAANAVIRRFGYLQLDTVAVTGARSHAIVLLSRLPGFEPSLAEELLQPGEPLFEYWGHEASWLPLELYPAFDFRRREYADAHPWWGDLLGEHPELARDILRRIEEEGPLRSVDLEGRSSSGWWVLKKAKKVATALWSSGRLAIRERRGFQRVYDLSERVIPEQLRSNPLPYPAALRLLLLRALAGHGWATSSTLAATWRLRKRGKEISQALHELAEEGQVVACELCSDDRGKTKGWVRPTDLELVAGLRRTRPRREAGVLLSPFDPLLWDRARVALLFGFDQVLEIFKPASDRVYGYYCMPVLAGDRLVARVDLKCDRSTGRLEVLACHHETERQGGKTSTAERRATATAVQRYADALGVQVDWDGGR